MFCILILSCLYFADDKARTIGNSDLLAVQKVPGIIAPYPIQTMTCICSDRIGAFTMVEVRGVEPLSESTLTGPSPGADGYCGSLSPRSPSGWQAVTPAGQVRVIIHGRGNSFPPHGRHINDAFPGLWPLRFRRLPLIRQSKLATCCCYLIYKLPVLWRSSAAARWSASIPPSKPVHPGTDCVLPADRELAMLRCPPLPITNAGFVMGA